MQATTSQCRLSIWRDLFEYRQPEPELPSSPQEVRQKKFVSMSPVRSTASSWGLLLGDSEPPLVSCVPKPKATHHPPRSNENIPTAELPAQLRQVARTLPIGARTSRSSLPSVLLSQQESVNVFVGKRAIVFSNHFGICLSSIEFSALHSLRLSGGRYDAHGALDLVIPEEAFHELPLRSSSPSSFDSYRAQLHILANFKEHLGGLSGESHPERVEVEVATLEAEEITIMRIREALQYQWDQAVAERRYRDAMQESNQQSYSSLTLPVVEPDPQLVAQGARTRFGVQRHTVKPKSAGSGFNASSFQNAHGTEYHRPQASEQHSNRMLSPTRGEDKAPGVDLSSRSKPKLIIRRPRSPQREKQQQEELTFTATTSTSMATPINHQSSTDLEPRSISQERSSFVTASYTRDLGPLKQDGTKTYVGASPMPHQSPPHHRGQAPLFTLDGEEEGYEYGHNSSNTKKHRALVHDGDASTNTPLKKTVSWVHPSPSQYDLAAPRPYRHQQNSSPPGASVHPHHGSYDLRVGGAPAGVEAGAPPPKARPTPTAAPRSQSRGEEERSGFSIQCVQCHQQIPLSQRVKHSQLCGHDARQPTRLHSSVVL